jgi:beta-glucanase (GH16 family)
MRRVNFMNRQAQIVHPGAARVQRFWTSFPIGEIRAQNATRIDKTFLVTFFRVLRTTIVFSSIMSLFFFSATAKGMPSGILPSSALSQLAEPIEPAPYSFLTGTSSPDEVLENLGMGWQLSFGDEFNGEELDSINWVTCFPWGTPAGCGSTTTPDLWYLPENVSVNDGTLKLQAFDQSFNAPDGQTYPYTSGMITSSRYYGEDQPYKYSFKFGLVEMRAKMPAGQGLWPAFWLLPPEGKWPPEIDVMEFLGHELDSIHLHYHYEDDQGKHQDYGGEWTGPDFSDDFHVFAIEWAPDAIIWAVDGVERQRYTGPFIADEAMYLIANLQVGGDWPGNPEPETNFPATFEIDYIRVYTYGEPSPPEPIFADVSNEHPFFSEIEALYQAGYTAGCGTDPLIYCPDLTMNRAESAVYVERGLWGTETLPEEPSGEIFQDLPLDSWAAKWAHALWDDAFTAGCGQDPLRYCPWEGHTRTEGAVFYLRMLNGADYSPPSPEGIFSDMDPTAWGTKWAEAAYNAGLIPECSNSSTLSLEDRSISRFGEARVEEEIEILEFCPDDPLTRGLAAYMMVQAKGLAQ